MRLTNEIASCAISYSVFEAVAKYEWMQCDQDALFNGVVGEMVSHRVYWFVVKNLPKWIPQIHGPMNDNFEWAIIGVIAFRPIFQVLFYHVVVKRLPGAWSGGEDNLERQGFWPMNPLCSQISVKNYVKTALYGCGGISTAVRLGMVGVIQVCRN